MSTTFISRTKVAFVAVAATLMMALGMSLVATADAQAVTVKNGAKYISVTFGKSVSYDYDKDGKTDKVLFTYEGEGKVKVVVNDRIVSGFHTTVGAQVNDDGTYSYKADELIGEELIDSDDPSSYTARLIILKNKTAYFYLKSTHWNSEGDPVYLESLTCVNTLKNKTIAAAYYDVYSVSVKEVNGNSIYLRYTQDDTYWDNEDDGDWGTFRTNSVLYFNLKFTYSSSMSSRLSLSSTSVTPLYTTKWRKIGASPTKKAYKYSSLGTYKFSIKNNSYVQVKKISVKYCPDSTIRYYVKTKSGKYGWISGDVATSIRGGA